MPHKIRLKKDQIVGDYFYKNGSTVEVESSLAQYLLGMGEAALAGDNDPITPPPNMGERPDSVLQHLKKLADEQNARQQITQMTLNDMIAAAVEKKVAEILAAQGIKQPTPEELKVKEALTEEQEMELAASKMIETKKEVEKKK